MLGCFFNANPFWCFWSSLPWWAQAVILLSLLLIVGGIVWRVATLAKAFGGWPAVIGALGILGTLAAIFLSPKAAIRDEVQRRSAEDFSRPKPSRPVPVPESERRGTFNRDTGRFNE